MRKIVQVENATSEELKKEISEDVTKHVSIVIKELMKDLQSKQKTEFITSKEASATLGVTLPTLFDWRKKGIISAYRIGNKIRFNRQELMESLIKIDEAI
ncbi:helix-turn-helix domain-containing protein [Polaribacter sp.]|uniref:helix-turn-helix domain-containing protein n=1 Tax=Polaribacter sp. TaxID=1920175 RepID=UPI0040482C28